MPFHLCPHCTFTEPKKGHSSMADHQRIRIYPAEATEAAPPPPTVPLMAHGSSRSEKSLPVAAQQQHQPTLAQHARLVIQSPKPKRCCFCKCICWTLVLIIFLLIILGATVGIIYLVFKPKLPNYSVNSLGISDLRLNFDMTLYAKFDVKITEFYQGHLNKTVLNVSLTGQVQAGSTLMAALQQQQQTGRVPLDLKVHAPVAVKLGRLKLRKVRVRGECMLTVDSLSANNPISIKASDCKFRVKL